MAATTIITLSVINAQSLSDKPKHFTIFDSVGEMASGMAYVHVAIPFNLTTYTIQADILGTYLFKLSRVVDSNATDKNSFLNSIREIARYGQTRLERLKNRINHLDQILPYDGDSMDTDRLRRTVLDSMIDDEVIDYEKYTTDNLTDPIEIITIIKNQDTLKTKNNYQLQEKLDQLKKEYALFIKTAQINNKHRYKRQITNATTLHDLYYTVDWTHTYNKAISAELDTLTQQKQRLDQIRKDILQQSELAQNKLIQLTNQQWTPDMDSILHKEQFTKLNTEIDDFRNHLQQSHTDKNNKFVNKRVATNPKNNTGSHRQNLIDGTVDAIKMVLPNWLTSMTGYRGKRHLAITNEEVQTQYYNYTHNTPSYTTKRLVHENIDLLKFIMPDWILQQTESTRQKREYVTNHKDIYIQIAHNKTLQLSEKYRTLQIEINELILDTISDLKDNIQINERLTKYAKLHKEGTKTEFFRFEDLFRETPNSTTTHNQHHRQKRVAPMLVVGVIAGTLGTFLGMYNTWEIMRLKSRLNQSDKNHNMLVHVTQRQEEQINRITENMNAICLLISMMIKYNPTLISEQISAQIALFEHRLTIATNAVQQLQHQRLAIDFLDTSQMDEMHRAVKAIADERGYTLLPERISDYYQIETSYLRNGQDILIMLHVPCIIHSQLLTIYKYIPLPFPVPKFIDTDSATIGDLINKRTGQTSIGVEDDMDALVIVPEAEMIAVSKEDHFRIVTQGDLASCIKRNKIYLCENHQVLHTDLSNSCLGSIYSNFELGIKQNCKLTRKKLTETVYQLSSTNYLVFTPQPYKATIQCKSGTNTPIFLTKIFKLTVPEDCHVQLKSHKIMSDYNIRISPEPLDVPWSLDPMELPADILLDAAIIDDKLRTLQTNLRILLNETSTKTDFQQMLNFRMHEPSSYPWFIWAGVIAAISALLLLTFWYIHNAYQFNKDKNIANSHQPVIPQHQIITHQDIKPSLPGYNL